jgi:proline iminopeptidase
MKEFYPHIEPYAVHTLDVGAGHQLYVEECGNAEGIPVVFLHGGPGSGCKGHHRCFFNPDKYRIVLLDQRGSGRSKPTGEVAGNTTADLLGDLEWIRQYLRIQKWCLFGGSWGAALALLYAQAHPARVSAMVLRGTFLARQEDLDWYVKTGANRIYPERFAELREALGHQDGEDLIAAAHAIMFGADELAQRRIARAWSVWGGQVALGGAFDPSEFDGHVPAAVVQQARIELHYAFHRYFIEENQIIRDSHLLPDVPIMLIHGRRDLVCPVESAVSLHDALTAAELKILPNAGHIASGADMIDALVDAADNIAESLSA